MTRQCEACKISPLENGVATNSSRLAAAAAEWEKQWVCGNGPCIHGVRPTSKLLRAKHVEDVLLGRIKI